jgi:multiple sugar transport system ATP-binding protein
VARVDLVDVSKTLRPGDAKSKRANSREFSIKHLDLSIPDGQTMVVLGPSGCGKSTLLRIIAGLIPVDSGEVRYDDVSVNDLEPAARQIGMVFQTFALYPNRTSRDNVRSFFWFRKKTPELGALERAKLERTSQLMGVELEHLLDRMPKTLSGGEQQRVAIARCITREAALFLVDEPFSNLDQGLRERYRVNLKHLLREYGITTVYVTHDHHEAVLMADLIAIMNRGRIEQVGSVGEVYDSPRSAFVASFLNLQANGQSMNFFDPEDIGRIDLGDVRLGVRPEDIEVVDVRHPDGLTATVLDVVSIPPHAATLLTARLGASELQSAHSGPLPPVKGDSVGLLLRKVFVFDRETGSTLRIVSSLEEN